MQHCNILFQSGIQEILGTEEHQTIYFGDHLAADVAECREKTEWRTCLIVPELRGEEEADNEESNEEEDDICQLKLKLKQTVDRNNHSVFRSGCLRLLQFKYMTSENNSAYFYSGVGEV